MKTLRRFLAIMSIALLFSIFLAACGTAQATPTTTTATNANTTNTGTNANATNMGTNYQATPATKATPTAKATMGMQPTPAPTGAMTGDNGNKQALIHTAFVMLNGKKVHVLTNNKGFLLYYYMKDTNLTSKCTGACAQNWPPVLSTQGMMTVSSSIPLPHKLSAHKTANGNQVFYDGHALYTYAGDTKAGQFNGRGMDKAWYLVGFTL